jgi:hypothetical protein
MTTKGWILLMILLVIIWILNNKIKKQTLDSLLITSPRQQFVP